MFMTVHKTIERLEAVLKKKEWKKKTFCDRMGISTQIYNNWRSRGIPANKLRAAAEVVHVSREWLEDGDDYTDDLVAEEKTDYPAPHPQIKSEIARVVTAFNKLNVTQQGLILMLMEHMNEETTMDYQR